MKIEMHRKFIEERSSEWKCYLFGSKPSSPNVFIYHPHPDNIPNFFVRWMMKICLGCTWVKERTENE